MNETASIIKVVDGQIVVQQELVLFLQHLRQQSDAITIHDRDTYGEALELCKQSDDAVKQVMAAAEPERLALRKKLEELLAARDKVVAQIVSVTDSLSKNARQWNIADNDARQREQNRINEEARQAAIKANRGKKPENRVAAPVYKVTSDLPTVPGKRIVVHWRFEVIDPSKVKREYMSPDSVKINALIRQTQDIDNSQKIVGGIRVWKE